MKEAEAWDHLFRFTLCYVLCDSTKTYVLTHTKVRCFVTFVVGSIYDVDAHLVNHTYINTQEGEEE